MGVVVVSLDKKQVIARAHNQREQLRDPTAHAEMIAITQAAHFSVIDAATGKVVYEKELKFGGAQTYPSVTLAGRYIFLSRESGATLVFKPGREPEQVAENQLELFRSCPVFIGKRMYVRTAGHLYCIGE